MSALPIDCRRLFAFSLVALLCTSLFCPAVIAAENDPLANATVPSEPERSFSTDEAIGSEPATTARIDPALEDTDGVVEAIVRLEDGERAAITTGETDAATLQATANRSQTSLERAAEATGGLEVERQFWLANAALVRIDTDRVDLETIASIDGVVEIHADTAVELTTAATTGTGTDPSNAATEPDLESPVNTSSTVDSTEATMGFGNSYTDGLEQLSVPAVHEEYDARGAGATVAVLDTGADDSHPDVQVDQWRDFSGGSSTPMDYNTHGTHVAGTVAGGSASGTQIGVAPEVELLVGAVLTDCNDDSCVGRTSDVIAGMEWAVANDADVISLSLGSEGYTSSYISAVRSAEASGTVVVAGAGNGGDGVSASPGNVYDAISVGAVDEYDRVTEFSSGEAVDTFDAWGWYAPSEWPSSYLVPTVAAPGDRVLSAAADGGYVRKSGTSMATPHVAGVIALLQGATDRSLEPDGIREVLTETATKPSGEPDEQDTRYGHGIVDAAAALEEAGSFATVEGTVSDTVTNNPIEAATVTLEADDGTVYETTPGSRGQYALEGIPGDREYTLTVTASGYESTSESAFVPSDETTRRDVSLAGDGTIEVTLEDAQFGSDVTNATVEASAWYGTYPLTRAGDGVYVAENAPSRGEYTLTATAPGYDAVQREVTVTDAQRVTERLELTGNATLEVVAEDAVTETGVSNASVTVERPDGTAFDVAEVTDDDGTLTTSVPGTDVEYTVRVGAHGYEANTTSISASSGTDATVNVSLEGDSAINVSLTDAQFGDGVTNATVEATGERGTYTGTHEGDGEYAIESVRGDDEYAIDVTAEGYADETRTVAVGANETATDRVVLEGDATLSLTVVDEDDGPIDDATVTIERSDGVSVALTEKTDSDGTLEVAVPGTDAEYTVTVDAPGYATEIVSTGSISSGATESVTVALSADDDGVPGFGGTIAAVALLATLTVGLARRRS